MEKQNKRTRDIRFFSKKNNDLISVHTALARNYANLLEQDTQVQSFQTNVPLADWSNKINIDGIRTDYRKSEWTTNFMICMSDGTMRIREVVEGAFFSASMAEKLEISRRYWKSRYVEDWKVVLKKE